MNNQRSASRRLCSILSGTVIYLTMALTFPRACLAFNVSQVIAGEDSKAELPVDIVGFNYTDRVIDSFSVNDQGGGNVFLSSRTSGGGKSTCCIRLPGVTHGTSKIRVRWQVDGCIYLTKSRISGEKFKNIFPYYKQADIELSPSRGFTPQHLEVHFYPDGKVRAELTAELSLPRLSLEGKRPDQSRFPRCRDDKKPE
jgi:hypothetical protein